MPFSTYTRWPCYGDGSLGDVTINGTDVDHKATVTIYGPKCYRNLTIGEFGILQAPTSGWGPLLLMCSGTLTVAGHITADAVAEIYDSNQGGWAGNGGYLNGSTGTYRNGYAPQLGIGKGNGGLAPRRAFFPVLGGGGGCGTNGQVSVGNGGSSTAADFGATGLTVPPLHVYGDLSATPGSGHGSGAVAASGASVITSGHTLDEQADGTFVLACGVGGGCGGDNANQDSGYGKGGAGGGAILICARRIIVTGSITANGQNGLPSTVAGCGGGGGAGGGGIFLFCESYTNTGTVAANGGAGGAKAAGDGTTASAGGAGANGIVRIWRAA
jgi:hypothetical protein